MAEIDIGGETFNVLVEGDENKPALLLANALGTDLHMWDAQVAALTNYFRVIRYDSRGSGSSVTNEGPYSIAELGQDALALLDALGLGKVHFIGLSLGGMVGQWLLSYAPERISRAVLANTAAHIPGPDLWNSRINAAREAGMTAVAEACIERWFTRDFHNSHPEAVAPIADMLIATPVEGYAAISAAIRDMDLREAVRSIKAKVLVIVGKHDTALAESGGYLAQSIDGAELVTLDAAHLSNIEDAENFNQAIIEFLTAVEVPVKTPPLAKVSRRSRTVKRTVGTPPAAITTGAIRVAAKKAPTKKVPVRKAPVAKASIGAVSKSEASKKPAASKAAASRVPAKPSPEKKTVARKAVVTKTVTKNLPVKKAAVKKAVVSKASVRTGVAKKVESRTPTAKNVAAKNVAAKKTAVKKTAVKKIAVKKTAVTKAPAKKAAPAKTVATKAVATKAAANKPVANKAVAKKSAIKTAPSRNAPTKTAPVTKIPVKKAPVKKAVAKSAVAKSAVTKQAPVKTAVKAAAPRKAPARKAGSRNKR